MVNLLRIKDLAEKRKISIRELAEMVGLKENQIHVMCRTNSTKIDTLEKIANALNVSIVEFFDEPPHKFIHTEGDMSPVSESGKIEINGCDAVMAERVRALEKQNELLAASLRDKEQIISLLKSQQS